VSASGTFCSARSPAVCGTSGGPGAPLLLLPQHGLGLLPLHAAARVRDGERRHLADDYTITYAPSASWRRSCAATVARQTHSEPEFLPVVNPDGDLRFADLEGRDVAAMFRRSCVLAGDAARRSDVFARAVEADYLHFACYGTYDWDEPARSCLRLRPPEQVTLADVLADQLALRSTRLVMLSACETGLTEFRTSPDEYVGLPAGFVLAGAPGVISALWKVDDAATFLLMTAFYREHLGRERANPAAALGAAQRWLRGLTARRIQALGEAGSEILAWYQPRLGDLGPDDAILDEPFFWAGFTFTGA
jgi:CHAT domain-containing protein